jgi:DNA replication and repair protein RecF
MIIKKIQINNFRNIENCFLEFNENINYFVGNNAHGKTSFLESLYFLGHNKSFKTKDSKNIIQKNKEFFSIQAIVNDKKIKIKKTLNNKNNDIFIDNQKVLNSSILSKQIPIQLIAPDKGFLVGGDNKNKRYYLDWGMFHVEQGFLNFYKNSKKIQKNINNLILTKQTNQLDIWFKEFAKVNQILNNFRNNYLQELKEIINDDFFKILNLNKKNFNLKFNNGLPSGVENENDIYNFLVKNKEKILKNKYLKYGSHLANIDFYFDEKSENQLSRGQQKNLSIIFWLSQIIHLTKKNIKPVVLIDDISSELDNGKIEVILKFLEELKIQTFITSINPISEDFYKVENGEIVYNS